ncbi:MAG: polysaccharide deacetylase family protein [Steroidobacteraceae bacterium]
MSRSSPALRVSTWVHAAAAGATVLHPPAWPFALGAVVANHLTLMTAGLWPRSRLLGPNCTHLPRAARERLEVAITLDDGPDETVTPQVLDILDRHTARASFFVVGTRLASRADLGREILRRGHTLENHSHTHRHDFSLLPPRAIRREIEAAQAAIAAVGGNAQYFRAPAGLRNPFLDGELRRAGLQLVSWTRRGFDTVTRDANRVHARLTRELSSGDILLLHDGHAARTADARPVVLEVLPRLLDSVRAAGLVPVDLARGLAA